jgi:AhpC/TSA family protein
MLVGLIYTLSVQARLVLGLLASGACLLGCASSRQAVTDLDDHPANPFADKSTTAVVLIFISNDCPIANRYAPEINRLYTRFKGRGVAFWLVHADPNESPKDIRQHAREYRLIPPELRDPQHQLVTLAHVDVTPSAAVFLPDRRLVYHGRIDDRFVELGRERPEALHHELCEVLEAVVNYQPIPVAAAKAIGCYIPEAPR